MYYINLAQTIYKHNISLHEWDSETSNLLNVFIKVTVVCL